MPRLVDAGAAVLALLIFWAAVTWYGNRRRPAFEVRAPDPSQTSTPWRQLANVIAQLTLGRVLVLTVVPVAALTLAGSVAVGFDIADHLLRVNQERNPATYFHSALLFAAGAAALYLWRQGGVHWAVLAVCFTYLGLDEAAGFHEEFGVEYDVSQFVPLAPFAVAGGIATIYAFPELRAQPPALTLFAAGVVIWGGAAALDPWHAKWKSVIEELLEMAGTTLVLLALLVVATAAFRRE